MFHVILYQPEIPPNTGNIIRLCANMGAQLHLIGPLAFKTTEKACRRAGLDYHELSIVEEYENWEAFLLKKNKLLPRCFACSTKANTIYSHATFQQSDAFLFGPETRGLPNKLLENWSEDLKIRIPMAPKSRSLNLSNSTAIVIYEAWRQLNFQTPLLKKV